MTLATTSHQTVHSFPPDRLAVPSSQVVLGAEPDPWRPGQPALPPIAGLVAHYDASTLTGADGDPVAAWAASTPDDGTLDLAAAVGAEGILNVGALNGLNTLTVEDGDVLSSSQSFVANNAATGWTRVALMRRSAGTGDVYGAGTRLGAAAGGTVDVFLANADARIVKHGTAVYGSIAHNPADWATLALSYDPDRGTAGDVLLWINDHSRMTTSEGNLPTSTAATPFQVLGSSGDSFQVAELLIFDRPITDPDEWALVQDYLTLKWFTPALTRQRFGGVPAAIPPPPP